MRNFPGASYGFPSYHKRRTGACGAFHQTDRSLRWAPLLTVAFFASGKSVCTTASPVVPLFKRTVEANVTGHTGLEIGGDSNSYPPGVVPDGTGQRPTRSFSKRSSQE